MDEIKNKLKSSVFNIITENDNSDVEMRERELDDVDRDSIQLQEKEIINTLNIPITNQTILKESLKKVPCIVNYKKIFSSDQTYDAYTCFSCNNKPENICYICISNCHKGHKYSIPKKVNLKELKCSCSLKDHEVQEIIHNYSKVDESFKHLQCPLNEVLHETNMKYYYEAPTKDIYCLYCLSSCMDVLPINSFDLTIDIEGKSYNLIEEPLKLYNKKEKSRTLIAPKCNCRKVDNHDSFERNIYCLTEMIDNIYFDKFYNRIQLPAQIITRTNLMEKYFSVLIKLHQNISFILTNSIENQSEEDILLLKNNKYISYTEPDNEQDSDHEFQKKIIIIKNKYQLKELSPVYLNSIELLKSFERLFYYDFYNLPNKQLQSSFDLQFLLNLFKIPSIKDDNLFVVKINCLTFFRKFYILPKIKYQNWKNFSNFENTTPFHRLLFRQTFEEFTDCLNISPVDFLNLIDLIYLSIINDESKVKEEEIISLVVEFMEYLLLIITNKFDENDNMIYFFTQKIYSIMEIIYMKVEFEALMKTYIEKIILYILLINNDNLFLKAILKEDTSTSFEEKEKEPKKKSEIYGIFNDYFNKLQKKIRKESKNLTEKLIEENADDEDKKIKDDKSAEVPFDNEDKFSFQNGTFQNILIKTLFSYRKNKTITNYLESCYIYDILMNKDDYYAESILSVINCNKKLFSIELIEFYNNFSEYFSTGKIVSDFFEESLLGELRHELFQLEKYKVSFYDNVYTGEHYYKAIKGSLASLKNKLQRGSLDDGFLFEKQILLYKLNFCDTLIAICASFAVNNHFKLYMREESESIMEDILDIFNNYLLRDNPFLLAIFFNSEPLNYLFEISNNKLLEFYLISLEVLNKYRYKVNTEPLLSKITTLYNISEWSYYQDDFIIIFKIMNICLINNKEKTLGNVNNIISNEIKRIIGFESFVNYLDWLIFGVKNDKKTWEYDDDGLSNNASENEYYIDHGIYSCLYNILTCCSNLNESFFYLINDYLCIDRITLLLDLHDNLNPEFRRVLTILYTRFYVKSCYHIVNPSNIKNDEFKSIENVQEINLIAKLTLKQALKSEKHTEDKYYKQNSRQSAEHDYTSTILLPKTKALEAPIEEDLNENLKTNENIASTKNLQKINLLKKNSQSKTIIRKTNTITNARTSFNHMKSGSTAIHQEDEDLLTFRDNKDKELQMNDYSIIEKDKTFGLSQIIKNLEKFRTIYSLVFTQDQKEDLTFFIDYFTDVILIPTVFSLYKVLYYSPSTTAKIKYLVYKVIYLFLSCMKFFLQVLINNNSKNLISNNIIKVLLKFIHIEDPTNVEELKKKIEKEDSKVIINNEVLDVKNKRGNIGHVNKKSSRTSINSIINGDMLNAAKSKEIIKIFERIDTVYQELNRDLEQLSSSTYEHLNLIVVLETFYKHTILFKPATKYMNLEYNITKANLNQQIHPNKNIVYFVENLIGKTFKNIRRSGLNFMVAFNHLFKETEIDEYYQLTELQMDLLQSKCFLLQQMNKFIETYNEKKSEFDSNNVICSIFENEEDPDIQEIKKSIAFDLLFKLIDEQFFLKSISCYDENDTILISIINKLFITDPTLFQELIKNNVSIVKSCVFNYIQKQSVFLSQFTMIEFARLDSVDEVVMRDNLINIFEFLRLFCENHHKIYQTFIFSIQMTKDFTFMDFLFKLAISVLKSLEQFKERKQSVLFFKENSNSYFEELINKIFDLIIEILQGCLPSNFDSLANNNNFHEFCEISYNYLEFIEQEEEYEFYYAHFFRLINTYMEEITNSANNKILLIKRFDPKKLMAICTFCFKKLYYERLTEGEKEFINFSFNDEGISYHDKLLQQFLISPELRERKLFILSTGIYSYLKMASQYKQVNIKIVKLLANMEESVALKTKNLTEKNKINIITKKEIFLFFNCLIKDVEISYKFKDSIEEYEFNKYKELFEDCDLNFIGLSTQLKEEFTGIQKVTYLINMDSLFLNSEDMSNFVKAAPYDNFYTKLSYLLEYYNTGINNIIETRKNLWTLDSPMLNMLFNMDYNTMTIISVILCIIVNFCIFFGLKYTTETITHYASHEEKMIGMTDYKEEILYKVFRLKGLAYSFSITHLIFCFLVIANYISFGFYKYFYTVDTSEMTYWESFKSKVLFLNTLMKNPEIRPLAYNFAIGIKAILGNEVYFYYSLQLFSIFSFFPTMESVIIFVKSRYKQFLSAALLICIMILFYSSVSFFLFRNEFYNEDINQNNCDSLLHCFLYLFNYGIRSGSLGLPLKKIEEKQYWSEFIFDWVFYFILILIMLNIINGIIVDTFQALREQNNEKEHVKNNVCYICSIDRSKFEMKGVDYDYHLQKEHNILNYFHYIIKVLRTFEQDLNSMDFEVLKAIKASSTDFFPVKKALSLGD